MGGRRCRPLILLELNEINLGYIQGYIETGRLPNFRRIMTTGNVVETCSEKAFRELEPWIQWVSIHTGRTFSEHGVFRLGDVVRHGHEQIWEYLERTHGLKVAALAPMNAANRTVSPAFFLPDFWTRTPASGDWFLRRLSAAFTDAVVENAAMSAKMSSYVCVLLALVRYSLGERPLHMLRRLLRACRSHPDRAILFDELMVDLFLREWKRTRPDFASAFLNAGGHLQHHYLYNSRQYDGPNRNPEWYIASDADPILDVYEAYDAIIGHVLALPGSPRLLIATGLHQVPVVKPDYYWRLLSPEATLRKLGFRVRSAHQRMSRDFMVEFDTPAEALAAEVVLESCVGPDGIRIFGELENRGASLFVTLSYPNDIESDFVVRHRNGVLKGFRKQVVFVTPKNGEHGAEGFLYDSEGELRVGEPYPITNIFGLIDAHFGGKRDERVAA